MLWLRPKYLRFVSSPIDSGIWISCWVHHARQIVRTRQQWDQYWGNNIHMGVITHLSREFIVVKAQYDEIRERLQAWQRPVKVIVGHAQKLKAAQLGQ